MRRFASIALAAAAALALVACTEHPMKNAAPDPWIASPMSAPVDGFGATPGGVQDMELARELVAAGRVPPPEAFTVEGLFSEHDLPLDGPPCTEPLCLRAALGLAPDADGAQSAWVQVGFSSYVDPESYQRPDLTLVVVQDVSGSMWASYDGGPSPLALSKALLQELVAELEPSDQLALVTFGTEVDTPVPLGPVVDRDAVLTVVDGLQASGSTDLESGLSTGLTIATSALGQTDAVRVVLLSDERPNLGATDPSTLRRRVSDAADQGVGLTLIGTGLALDAQLMTALAGLRGGNAFSLMDPDDVDRILVDHWPWLACPLAFDLNLRVTPSGLSLAQAYGFPPDDEGAPTDQLTVRTVFLSRRRGAVLLQLTPDPTHASWMGTGAALQLDYETVDGAPRSTTLGASYDGQALDSAGQYLPQVGLARAVALSVLATRLRRATGLYATDRPQAVALLWDALDRITADAAHLGDGSLDGEVSFTAALLQLMIADAPQESLYGLY